MSRRAGLVPAAVLALALAACGGSSGSSGATGAATASAPAKPTGTLTVFAAASLTGVFTDLGHRLERADPGLVVRFDFAGSSALPRS